MNLPAKEAPAIKQTVAEMSFDVSSKKSSQKKNDFMTLKGLKHFLKQNNAISKIPSQELISNLEVGYLVYSLK